MVAKSYSNQRIMNTYCMLTYSCNKNFEMQLVCALKGKIVLKKERKKEKAFSINI